ncbi:YHS domain-containing (seleno)protein [Parasphingorhabdus sp. DH2-15]|uniref:YHS domain-containing (seleno)protein n=1 Tax=Parasphingorhabdus sp. DH2-15 TaxID=3444112 RepID=UPI003F6846E1
MKKIMTTLALALAVTSVGTIAVSAPALAGPTYTGLEGTTALKGYDAVSYFVGDGVPVKGKKQFKVTYKGADYFFATAANAAKFKKSPAKYAPQYGGHCAWALGANGALAPGDPTVYKVVDGKLYLNFNKGVQTRWNKDIPGFIKKGDVKWPSFPDTAKFGS